MRRFAGWERGWLRAALVMMGAVPLPDDVSGATVYNHMFFAVDYPHSGLLDISEEALGALIPDKAARALFGTVDEATFRNAVENA